MDTSDGNGTPDGYYGSAQHAATSEVAHLFRTPLGVITGYVGLMQLRDDPGQRMDSLQQIEAAATRLGDVVDLLISVLESEEGLSELLVERWQERTETAAHGERRSDSES